MLQFDNIYKLYVTIYLKKELRLRTLDRTNSFAITEENSEKFKCINKN